MTLILSQTSYLFSLQVSDRLVTRSGDPFDRISNKTVVYLAPDAIVSMGYTGPAYLDSIPTDQWIAETISGRCYERGRKPPSLSFGENPRWLHIGRTLEQIAQRLGPAFASPGLRADVREMMFELLLSGWQWGRRKRPRPIVAGIQKARGRTSVELWRGSRHLGRSFLFAGTPEQNLDAAGRDSLRQALKGIRSFDDAEEVLVRAIRAASRKTPYVGPNCLSVLIPPPAAGKIRVRYVSDQPTSLAIVRRSDGRTVASAPAAFSPWVIGPGLVHAPSVFAGRTTLEVGGFEVDLELPELVAPGLRGAIGSVERPPEPA